LFSKLFSNKHLIIILLSLILLVIVMGISIGNRELTWPEKLVKDAVSWGQNIVSTPAKAIAGFFEDVRDFTIIFQENKSLKSSLNQYSQVVAELNQFKEENKRLKEMLDYKEQTVDQYLLTVAKVIARSPDNWNNTIVIDKGSMDGITRDLAVVSTKGFIGKVYSVSNFSSSVQLISDTEQNGFVFAAIQSEPLAYGVIEGYNKETNLLILKDIDLNAKIEPGQLVTTSNLGGMFPTGLIIGEIVQIEEGENGGLTKRAYIRPASDLYHLDEVFIVMEDLSAIGEGK